MELLKFNDAPKNTRRGKNPAGFIGAGIMVAVMGLSSTLAGTITLNAGQTVEFGQGVVNTAACDGTITLKPSSSFVSDTFTVSGITISDIGLNDGGTGQPRGCRGQVLEIRAYGTDTTEPLAFNDTGTTKVLSIYIADTNTINETITSSLYRAKFFNAILGAVQSTAEGSPGLTTSGVATTPQDTGTALTITISNLKLSTQVVKFTLESRAPRAVDNS